MDNDIKSTLAAAVLMERIVGEVYTDKHSSKVQPLQWSILRYLQRMPEGRCELRWIAEFLGLTRAPVARSITTLKSRGMVLQRCAAADARTKTLELTPLGIEALQNDPMLALTKRIQALPAAERMVFLKSVRTLAIGSVYGTDDTA